MRLRRLQSARTAPPFSWGHTTSKSMRWRWERRLARIAVVTTLHLRNASFSSSTRARLASTFSSFFCSTFCSTFCSNLTGSRKGDTGDNECIFWDKEAFFFFPSISFSLPVFFFGIRKHSFFSFFSIYYSLGVCTGSYVYNSLTGGSPVVVFF